MKAIAIGVLIFVAAILVMGASPTLYPRSRGWPTNYGPTEIYWQAVPATLTDVTTRDAHITNICVFNPTGSPVTFVFQTKDASPLPLPLSGPVAAVASTCLALDGLLVKGGFSVSGSGLLYGTNFTN